MNTIIEEGGREGGNEGNSIRKKDGGREREKEERRQTNWRERNWMLEEES